MAEGTAMKAATEQERIALRAIIARGDKGTEWRECPCGWFYLGTRCPDKQCDKWKPVGKPIVKLYAHADDESYYEKGETLGLAGDALRTFANWGYELAFEGEVDLKTGAVKLLTVDGHKIQY